MNQGEFKLLVVSWQTNYFHDGSLRSTKYMHLEFKDLPPWFTMDMCDEKKVVEATPQMMQYLKTTGELISISLVENSKMEQMIDSAEEIQDEESTDSCGCDCEDCESIQARSLASL